MDAGLIDDLESDMWTVFAPTNEAFEELGSDVLDMLSNNTAVLTDLLLFHTVAGTVLKSDDLPCKAGDNLIEMSNGVESRT
jgi:transforming growth factor-beta-induced protein